MKGLPLAIAVVLHVVVLGFAARIKIDVPQPSSYSPWSDGRIDASIAAPAPETQVAYAPPPTARDVVPETVPEILTPGEAGAAAEGDEDDVTLPEGGSPPPASSIAVDGGPYARLRPKFAGTGLPRTATGGRIGRGRKGATGIGDGTALHAPVAPPPPAPAPEPVVPPPPPREPERVAAQVVSYTEPRYPESARVRQIEGVVRLEVEILEDASVGEIRVIESSGSRLLDDSAVASVRKWHFAPATVDGTPVRSVVTLRPIRFRLN